MTETGITLVYMLVWVCKVSFACFWRAWKFDEFGSMTVRLDIRDGLCRNTSIFHHFGIPTNQIFCPEMGAACLHNIWLSFVPICCAIWQRTSNIKTLDILGRNGGGGIPTTGGTRFEWNGAGIWTKFRRRVYLLCITTNFFGWRHRFQKGGGNV